MKPFIIIIVCLLCVVGLLGYITYKQDKIIQQPAEIEQPRFMKVDILGEIHWIQVDSEGRITDDFSSEN